jgi:hypothetical protein
MKQMFLCNLKTIVQAKNRSGKKNMTIELEKNGIQWKVFHFVKKFNWWTRL